MNPLINYPRTVDLAHWINERESIRLRREAGMAPPWTADPDMATVRYCNVRREDDKVTRWIRNNLVYSGPSVPVWVVVLARMVNRIKTLELIEPYVARDDLDAVKKALKIFRDPGPIWGNAYTISTCGKSMDKVDYVVDWVVAEVAQRDFSGICTLDAMYKKLMTVDGLGSFLAAQVVADLKNTPRHPLATAPDWHTFAAPGPGSLRGLVAYFGHPVTPSNFAASLSLVAQQVKPLVAGYIGAIHAQDMQNCMCEFSKYIRVREGGKARNNYDARNSS